MDPTKPSDMSEIMKFYIDVYSLIPDSTRSILDRLKSIMGSSIPDISKISVHRKDDKYALAVQAEIFKKMKTIIYYSYDNNIDSKLSYYKLHVDDVNNRYRQIELRRDISDLAINQMNSMAMNSMASNNQNIILIGSAVILLIGIVLFLLYRKK